MAIRFNLRLSFPRRGEDSFLTQKTEVAKDVQGKEVEIVEEEMFEVGRMPSLCTKVPAHY